MAFYCHWGCRVLGPVGTEPDSTTICETRVSAFNKGSGVEHGSEAAILISLKGHKWKLKKNQYGRKTQWA